MVGARKRHRYTQLAVVFHRDQFMSSNFEVNTKKEDYRCVAHHALQKSSDIRVFFLIRKFAVQHCRKDVPQPNQISVCPSRSCV